MYQYLLRSSELCLPVEGRQGFNSVLERARNLSTIFPDIVIFNVDNDNRLEICANQVRKIKEARYFSPYRFLWRKARPKPGKRSRFKAKKS